MGQDKDYPEPGVGMPIDLFAPHKVVDARNPASRQTIFNGAVEGHVLVKNTNKALPLKSPRLLSLYGYDAKNPNQNNPAPGFSSWVLGYETGDYLQALGGFIGTPQTLPLPQVAINGTIISGGGSGAVTPTYISSPFDALQARAIEDGSALFWDFNNVNSTAYVEGTSDACLVFINAWASEGIDRPGLHDDFSDALVLNVCTSLDINSTQLISPDCRPMQQHYCCHPQRRRPPRGPIHRPPKCHSCYLRPSSRSGLWSSSRLAPLRRLWLFRQTSLLRATQRVRLWRSLGPYLAHPRI